MLSRDIYLDKGCVANLVLFSCECNKVVGNVRVEITRLRNRKHKTYLRVEIKSHYGKYFVDFVGRQLIDQIEYYLYWLGDDILLFDYCELTRKYTNSEYRLINQK